MHMKKKKVYLTLQSGDVFEGYRFGASGTVIGELVFSTGMVGYVEDITDTANYGQLIVRTFPLVGNYGVARTDAQSEKAWASALIVREWCDAPSNFRMETTLDEYLKEKGVVGIYGVDTRQLTKILREYGAMNAKISDKPALEDMDDITEYAVKEAVKTVAPTQIEYYGDDNAKYTVALWNFGAKKNTINDLVKRGCRVISVPAFSKSEEILALGADGIVLSDGPGDPMEVASIAEEIKKVVGKVPVFGVGLGHQLLAMSFGAQTIKQKYGHRGSNQPVKCVADGQVYISTQNHGFEVDTDTLTTGKISFVNVNDGSCEGIDYADYKAFSVQFETASCVIGNLENPLYKKFFTLMTKEKDNA